MDFWKIDKYFNADLIALLHHTDRMTKQFPRRATSKRIRTATTFVMDLQLNSKGFSRTCVITTTHV
jgi:hypothetical protein